MTAATIAYALLFCGASLVFAGGLAYRIYDYARTPAPLKIPTTPAPITQRGVALRLAREVLLFESLFKANLWLWACGWLFHAGLALVLLQVRGINDHWRSAVQDAGRQTVQSLVGDGAGVGAVDTGTQLAGRAVLLLAKQALAFDIRAQPNGAQVFHQAHGDMALADG